MLRATVKVRGGGRPTTPHVERSMEFAIRVATFATLYFGTVALAANILKIIGKRYI